MVDRKKVIKGVHDARRYLEDKEWVDKSAGVHIDALNDALALLKEQKTIEPVTIKKEMFDEFYGAVSCCPKCGCMWVMYRENDMHYCPECGQAVKWE